MIGNVANVARQLRLLSRLGDEADVTGWKHAKTLAQFGLQTSEGRLSQPGAAT